MSSAALSAKLDGSFIANMNGRSLGTSQGRATYLVCSLLCPKRYVCMCVCDRSTSKEQGSSLLLSPSLEMSVCQSVSLSVCTSALCVPVSAFCRPGNVPPKEGASGCSFAGLGWESIWSYLSLPGREALAPGQSFQGRIEGAG